MRRALLVLAVLSAAVCTPARAQFWPNHEWWTAPPGCGVLECHPTSHLLGGGAVNLLARGPWITKSWRNTPLKRIAWCGVFQGSWEAFQVLEIKDYPVRTGLWDLEAALVGCAVTEGLLALVQR